MKNTLKKFWFWFWSSRNDFHRANYIFDKAVRELTK
jgi:hypothetical protein